MFERFTDRAADTGRRFGTNMVSGINPEQLKAFEEAFEDGSHRAVFEPTAPSEIVTWARNPYVQDLARDLDERADHMDIVGFERSTTDRVMNRASTAEDMVETITIRWKRRDI